MRNIDKYTPAFTLKSEGQSFPDELMSRVTSYEYEDDEKMDKLTLVFDNKDLEITDDTFFTQGRIIETKYGYVNELSDPNFLVMTNINGFKEITIECFQNIKQFDKKPYSMIWENSNLDAVVSSIANKYNLKYKVEERKDINGRVLKFDYIQPNIGDLSFLSAMGRDIGYVVWIEGDILHFMPRQYWQAPYLEFVYDINLNTNVIDYEPELSGINKESKIEDAGIDIENKSVYEVEEDGEDSEMTGLGEYDIDYDKIAGRGQGGGKMNKEPSHNENDAKSKVTGVWNENMEEQLKADLIVVGEPVLKSRKIINVQGIKKYSGKYYTAKIIHSINNSDGYISTGKLSRNSAWDDIDTKYAMAKLNTKINKNRLSVQQYLKKYPYGVVEQLYGK